jgi:glucose-1-phosphate cytidylyltransferase
LKVIILAGGKGTRISEETHDKPKPMVDINGKPILWHLMNIFSLQGFNEFIVATGYKGDVIKKWTLESNQVLPNWDINCYETGIETFTGNRVKMCLELYNNERILVTYGDALANISLTNLIKFHNSHGKLATVTAVRPPARFGYLEIKNGKVLNFSEKNQLDVGRINGGFFILEPKVLEYFDGGDEPFETGVLPLLTESHELMAYEHNGFWKPMDTLREKLELTNLATESSGDKPPWLIF